MLWRYRHFRFFQAGAESLIFVPGQARDNEIRVRLIRKDLIQSHGKIIRVFGGGIMQLLCDNDIIVIGLSMGEWKCTQSR
jgi:hypothetical protein